MLEKVADSRFEKSMESFLVASTRSSHSYQKSKRKIDRYRSVCIALLSRYCWKVRASARYLAQLNNFLCDQIYNEKIYDILAMEGESNTVAPRNADRGKPSDRRAGWNCAKASKEAPCLQIRQKLDGSVFVDGLTSRHAMSKMEMLQAFREVKFPFYLKMDTLC